MKPPRPPPPSYEAYHTVPVGWRASEIRFAYERLSGRSSSAEPPLIEADGWRDYSSHLLWLADRVSQNDHAAIELAIRFLEGHFMVSYAGYRRTLFARRLRQAELSSAECKRLHEYFSRLVLEGHRSDEFREYIRTWRAILSEKALTELLERLRGQDDGVARVRWLEERLVGRLQGTTTKLGWRRK